MSRLDGRGDPAARDRLAGRDVPAESNRLAGRELPPDEPVSRLAGRPQGRLRAEDLPTEAEQVEAISLLAEQVSALTDKVASLTVENVGLRADVAAALSLNALIPRVESLESEVLALTDALQATAGVEGHPDAGETGGEAGDAQDETPRKKKK